MEGVDKLFLLNAVTPDELTQGLITLGLSKRLGLKHITYPSVYKVDQFRDVPHFASKLAIEEALQEFEVPYSILRPAAHVRLRLCRLPAPRCGDRNTQSAPATARS